MKKNQNGVSMVSLVITIIVIIILAAVAFSGSQETIGRAGFSGFTTDIDSVRTAFLTENIPNLMGEQAAKNNSVSEAQAYNFLAKGGTTLTSTDAEHVWLSRGQAEAIPCTRIEPETAKAAIGIELPSRKVNTLNATGVEVSYFVTNKGDIFVWPPFERSDDGLFYVNDKVALPASATEEAIYGGSYSFDLNGVTIKIKGEGATTNDPKTLKSCVGLKGNVDETTLKAMESVYYFDERNAEQAEGIESKFLYNDEAGDAYSTIAGKDID